MNETKRNEAREEVKEWVTDKCHLDAAVAAVAAALRLSHLGLPNNI